MDLIGEIRGKLARNEFEFSQHAIDQSILRQIRVEEIRQAAANGEVIEDYPDDKYGPSCLVLGFTMKGDRCTFSTATRHVPWSRS